MLAATELLPWPVSSLASRLRGNTVALRDLGLLEELEEVHAEEHKAAAASESRSSVDSGDGAHAVAPGGRQRRRVVTGSPSSGLGSAPPLGHTQCLAIKGSLTKELKGNPWALLCRDERGLPNKVAGLKSDTVRLALGLWHTAAAGAYRVGMHPQVGGVPSMYHGAAPAGYSQIPPVELHSQFVSDLAWFGSVVPLGGHVEARDELGDWCRGIVVGEKRDAGATRRHVRVRFEGWGSGYDEWVAVAPLQTEEDFYGEAQFGIGGGLSANLEGEVDGGSGTGIGSGSSPGPKVKRRRVEGGSGPIPMPRVIPLQQSLVTMSGYRVSLAPPGTFLGFDD